MQASSLASAQREQAGDGRVGFSRNHLLYSTPVKDVAMEARPTGCSLGGDRARMPATAAAALAAEVSLHTGGGGGSGPWTRPPTSRRSPFPLLFDRRPGPLAERTLSQALLWTRSDFTLHSSTDEYSGDNLSLLLLPEPRLSLQVAELGTGMDMILCYCMGGGGGLCCGLC